MRTHLLPIIFISIMFSNYSGPDDPAGDVSAVRSSHMDGNRVYLYFQNTTELSDWVPGGLSDVSIWPNDGATGTRMVDGIALMVGAKVYIEDDGNSMTLDTTIVDDIFDIEDNPYLHELYFLQTSYREEMDHNSTNTLDWGFYPPFGYFNPLNDYPAMSDDEDTWPQNGWPSTGSETHWQGYWDGRFGKGVSYADLETYFVVNDAMDHEYLISDEVRYYPRPGKKIQSDASFQENMDWGGLGLRIEVRGFQWNNPLVRDALFWEYNISNISDYDITETSFGYWVDNAIGSEGSTDDEVGYFDTYLDLSYSWDYDGLGQAGVAPGIMGFAFLESPGISDDLIDNDQDGLVDEKRDNDAGNIVGPTDGIDNLNNFLEFYNLDQEDLKEHWSGDEDQDWIQSEFVDGVCTKVNDDVGLDGVGPGDLAYDGPDTDGTECNGRPDCQTGLGCEPNFGETDVSESDMIGLTTFRLFAVNEHSDQADTESVWFYNDRVIWDLMSDNVLDQFSGTPANLVELFAAGVFELKKGQTERISMAELHSFDPLTGSPGGEQQEPTALFELKNTVQLIYETDYRFAQPPRMPTLTAESKDGSIVLTWGNVSESSRDPFLPEDLQYDFEGYKIYRSTDKYLKDAQIITDGYGNPMFYEPIFQCDKVDGITGFSDVTVFGTSYYLGSDTGVKHHFIDTDVINGKTYYYALVAYDYGLSPTDEIATGIPPSENNAIIELDENEYVISTGPNVAQVYAKAPSAGYISSTFEIDDNKLNIGTGSINVDIFGNHPGDYTLTFETDTQFVEIGGIDVPNHIYTSMYSISGSDLSYSEENNFDTYNNPMFISDNFYFNEVFDDYALNIDGVVSDIINGLQIRMNPADSIGVSNQFWYQKESSNPQIFISPWPNINHRESRIVPWDFNIYFSDDSLFYTQTGLIPYGDYGVFDTNENNLQVNQGALFQSMGRDYPFYVYNLTLQDTMSLIGLDDDGNGFNVWEDRIIVGSSDASGKWLGTTCEIDFQGILESQRPGEDDIYSVRFDRHFWEGDTLQISVYGDNISSSELEDDMNDIKVVPNPYVMTNLLEESIYNTGYNQRRKLMFTNLPSKCFIEIYTTSGILVDRIEVNNNIDNGVAYWDLLSNESLEVSAGMYVYYVKSLVDNKESEKIGKFAIIK